MNEHQAYVPGMCNINREEIAYRKKAMLFGVGVSIVVLLACLLFNVAWWGRILLLFVPVYIAAIGVLQVRNKFCVSYGAKGMQNATDGNSSATSVSSDSAKLDNKKARKMNFQALAITLVVITVCAYIPGL